MHTLNILESYNTRIPTLDNTGTTSNTKATKQVHKAFQSGFESPEIGIGVWLQVTPQLIARIQTKNANIRKLLTRLLTRVGKTHPQALIYALTVASNSSQRLRKKAATQVLTEMRQNWGTLVDAAQIVSKELVRVAILWHEVWHGGLEEASRLYFGDKSISGMLECLKPLHKLMVRVFVTIECVTVSRLRHRPTRHSFISEENRSNTQTLKCTLKCYVNRLDFALQDCDTLHRSRKSERRFL